MRKIICLFSVLFICLVLSACSSSNKGLSNQNEKEASKPKYPEILNIGDTLSIPAQYEIIFKSVEFASTVEPPKASGYYNYYEVKDAAKIYYHAVFHVKNLGPKSLDAGEAINVKVLYDGQYEYTGFSTIEENGGADFAFTSEIDPLDTGRLHFLVEVPKEVSDSGKSVELFLLVNNQTILCGNMESSNVYTIGNQTDKPIENTSFEKYTKLNLDETIVENDYCEMTIKHAEFTQTVMPTNASGFYSYYEVKDNNKTYAHLIVNYKNLKTTGANADEIATVKLLYDNTYSYTGFSAIEESGGSDFTFSNITEIDPLDIGVIHYIIEVPKIVQESSKPVIFIIKFQDSSFYYQFI